MHFLFVIFKVSLLIKTLAAHIADVFIIVIVSRTVPYSRGRAPESFLAELAAVGLLVGMSQLMPLHVLLPGESSMTELTVEQEALRVEPSMHRERCSLSEAFATGLADVGPLVRVSALVFVPSDLRRKSAFAVVALVVLDLLVNVAHMPIQRRSRREALATDFAGARTLVRVHAPVRDVVVRSGQKLGTLLALVVGSAIDDYLGSDDLLPTLASAVDGLGLLRAVGFQGIPLAAFSTTRRYDRHGVEFAC